jgi:CheY-like chemotaxis protein
VRACACLDDNATAAQAITDMLLSWGMIAKHVQSGKQALDYLSSCVRSFDINTQQSSSAPGSGTSSTSSSPTDKEIALLENVALLPSSASPPRVSFVLGVQRIPDLLVVDAHMPIQNGLALVNAVRMLGGCNRQQLPVIMLSRIRDRDRNMKSLVNGFARYPAMSSPVLSCRVLSWSRCPT